MTEPMEQSANAEQIQYWNDQAGPRWVASQEALDRMIEPFGMHLLDRAKVAAGERVLDVGCGCGALTLEAGRRTGPSGLAQGVDISQVMLARARERAAGKDHIQFVCADAQVHDFAAKAFDLVTSRFGVMFFGDPRAAFANLRKALRDGGRVAFACWQPPQVNPWVSIPMAAAIPHLPPQPPPDPTAPGPFSLSDPERVRAFLEGAGFAEVACEPYEDTVCVGGSDLEESVDMSLEIGPTSRLLRDADAELREQVRSAVRAAVAPHHGERGIELPGAIWVVHAR